MKICAYISRLFVFYKCMFFLIVSLSLCLFFNPSKALENFTRCAYYDEVSLFLSFFLSFFLSLSLSRFYARKKKFVS